MHAWSPNKPEISGLMQDPSPPSHQKYSTDLHMFWAYGALSKLERLCLSSFIQKGYSVNLWTYGKIPNVPTQTSLRDAREILPESRVFLNLSGSYASFADLFRYVVLNTRGGIYSDTDVVALLPFSEFPKKPFFVTERVHNQNTFLVNNNLIFNPTPIRGNIIDLAQAVAERFPPEKIIWSEIGPQLLTSLVLLQQQHGIEIREPDFSNPINYWDCPSALLSADGQISPKTGFLHCYSGAWQKAGLDKEAPYPEGSLMARFEKEFLQEGGA